MPNKLNISQSNPSEIVDLFLGNKKIVLSQSSPSASVDLSLGNKKLNLFNFQVDLEGYLINEDGKAIVNEDGKKIKVLI